jgi:hypothetical protein
MKNEENNTVTANEVVTALKNILPKVSGFVTIMEYLNSKGELANHKVNLGFNYANAKLADIETLKAVDVTTLAQTVEQGGNVHQIDSVILEKARTALINAFIKPNKARSEGQINAYTNVSNGVRVHNESGDVYVYALANSKEVIVEGDYSKEDDKVSRALTLAKDILRKGLMTSKFRNFHLEGGEVVNSRKQKLVIG